MDTEPAARSASDLLLGLGSFESRLSIVCSCVKGAGAGSAVRYHSVGEDGSNSGSERLLWCGRLEICTCDSDVLRGRIPPIPKPTVAESLCPGKISPKSKPFARPEAAEEPATFDSGIREKCVMDSVVVVVVLEELAFLGLLIRLANDWELLETWSSAANFAR